MTRVTYLGTVNGTRVPSGWLMARDRGCILQVGSALVYRSIPLQSAYCGAKAAVRGFTDSIRTELKHDGSQVRIAMIQLSAFNTPQVDWASSRLPRRLQPVPPIFQPQLAARAMAWVAGHPRRELWLVLPAVKAISRRGLCARRPARGKGRLGESADLRSERAPRGQPVRTSAGRVRRQAGCTAARVAAELLLAVHRAKLQWVAVAIAAVTITVALV